MASAIASPPLNRRGVLCLLAAIALVLAPHALRQPGWVSGFVMLIWAWRVWLTWRGLRRPPKALIAGLAVVGVLLAYASYGTLLGRDAGVTLLQLMLVLKLLEMRNLRDAMVAVFLGFFVVLTHFLHSQTLPTGAYMLVVIGCFVAALIALNRQDEPSPATLALASVTLLLQAVPLMLILFLLFPRIQGPLWGMPKNASAGISGLSEEMAPGSIGSLALSDAIAFRAEFDGAIPPVRALYWRAVVMEDFDGRIWRAIRRGAPVVPPSVIGVGDAVAYSVTIEPHSRRWLFALDLPTRLPAGARLDSAYQLLAPQPIASRSRYALASHLDYRAGTSADDDALQRNLALPAGNPRTLALAAQLQRQAAADGTAEQNSDEARAIIRATLDYFRAQAFVYTLFPAVLGEDAVDQFLFDSRSGFCEHYAGAFTLLMRAAGIPARVVTGYQGGEVNDIGDYLIVRQAEAHAWSEVWLAGQGWTRIDPTAAVSPARVDQGIRAVIPVADLLPGLIGAEQIAWLNAFRFSWDTVNNQWNQWVLGYNFERQKRLLAQMGRKDASWQDLTIALLVAGAVVIVVLSAGLLLRRTRQRRDPALIAYERFCARLARLGVVRAPHEGPLDFCQRASAQKPELAEGITTISVSYMEARYARAGGETLARLETLVRDFSV